MYNLIESRTINDIEICLIEDMNNDMYIVTRQKRGCGKLSHKYHNLVIAFDEFLDECDDAKED